MARMLLTVTWPGERPSLREVCEKYGLRPHEVDEDFGMIEIDPDAHLYTLRVDQDAAARVSEAYGDEVDGPFGDVRIGPMDARE
jgi:hypothetical protein